MTNIAMCRVSLAINEATLEAVTAITSNPDTSAVVAAQNEACVDSYMDLMAAIYHSDLPAVPEEIVRERQIG